MKLIKDRDRRTVYRKLRKEEFDEKLSLSTGERKYRHRLLDEGMIITGDGNPDFYIAKGTIQAYYDNLPEDLVGTVTLGHLPFENFPIVLGTWTKDDLEIVDLGNGRKGLDVEFSLNTDLNIVQDLLKMPYDLGLSAEVYLKYDSGYTELVTKQLGTYVPVAVTAYIENFSIVGDVGNVNSSGLDLKGDN